MLDSLRIRHVTFTHVAPDPTLACIEEGAAEMRVSGSAAASDRIRLIFSCSRLLALALKLEHVLAVLVRQAGHALAATAFYLPPGC